MKNVVMYHSKCFDGTMAAAGALRAYNEGRLEDLSLYSITYPKATLEEFFAEGGPYKYVAGGDGEAKFHFVDFCPKPDVVVELVRLGHEVVILDHHKTSQQDTKVLEDMPCVDLRFDMTKSGARLSWEYFVGEVPPLVKYVEDRDLWKWELDNTREAIAWLAASAELNNPESFLSVIEEDLEAGVVIGKYLVKEMLNQVKNMGDRFRLFNSSYGKCAVVNATCYPSEVAEYIYDNHDVPFVMVYSVGKDGRVLLSLRSKAGRESSADVSEIAKKLFNGGGHKHAAGGVTSLEYLHDILEASENPGNNLNCSGSCHC